MKIHVRTSLRHPGESFSITRPLELNLEISLLRMDTIHRLPPPHIALYEIVKKSGSSLLDPRYSLLVALADTLFSECSDLNEKVPIPLEHLNTWSPGDGTVWGGTRAVVFLKGVCH